MGTVPPTQGAQGRPVGAGPNATGQSSDCTREDSGGAAAKLLTGLQQGDETRREDFKIQPGESIF